MSLSDPFGNQLIQGTLMFMNIFLITTEDKFKQTSKLNVYKCFIGLYAGSHLVEFYIADLTTLIISAG